MADAADYVLTIKRHLTTSMGGQKPCHTDQFTAWLGDEQIGGSSSTPVWQACHILSERGAPAGATVESWHEGAAHCAMRLTVGYGAEQHRARQSRFPRQGTRKRRQGTRTTPGKGKGT